MTKPQHQASVQTWRAGFCIVDFPSYKTSIYSGFPTFFRYVSNDFQGIPTAMMTCQPCQDPQLKREEALLGGDMCKNPARCDLADLATPQAESASCAFRTGDSQHDPPCHKHGRDSYTYIFIHTYYIYTITKNYIIIISYNTHMYTLTFGI